jgi:hypothetical protein
MTGLVQVAIAGSVAGAEELHAILAVTGLASSLETLEPEVLCSL